MESRTRNPRGTTPHFKTPIQTRPRKAEPETTPTLDFKYKTPKSKGDVPEMLIPEPDPTLKSRPEPAPPPTFDPRLHHYSGVYKKLI